VNHYPVIPFLINTKTIYRYVFSGMLPYTTIQINNLVLFFVFYSIDASNLAQKGCIWYSK